jgi:hypothetical protein
VQTLWSQYARRSLDVLPTSGVFARENDRLQRLAFIEGVVRRKINSTKELSSPEAIRVISALNQTLGLAAHQRRSREAGNAAGTHGRRADGGRSVQIAGGDDLARIERAYKRLGWDEKRFNAWLMGDNSPIGKKPGIQTVADANRVWWALKRFLKREGLWED